MPKQFSEVVKNAQAMSDDKAKEMLTKIDNCIDKVLILMGDEGLDFKESTIVPERLQTIINGLKFDTPEYKQCAELEQTIYAKTIKELYQASMHPDSVSADVSSVPVSISDSGHDDSETLAVEAKSVLPND